MASRLREQSLYNPKYYRLKRRQQQREQESWSSDAFACAAYHPLQ